MNLHPAFAAGHVAVITGAADGIGRAAAERFSQLGLHVLMADCNGARLEQAATALRSQLAGSAVRIGTQVVDVADLCAIEALKVQAYASFGRVDVLMNNAGTSEPSGSWQGMAPWRRLLEVNLFGILNGVQAFTAAMISQGGPALIINTGSKQGITNPPGNPAYNVSKAGVKAATEALQYELRNSPGCQVSAHLLVPGYTYTGLTHRGVAPADGAGCPPGAWLPAQVIDYLLERLARGSFYIICPDNEVSSADDARRIAWAAQDMTADRPALSRWHADYAQAFKDAAP